MANRWIYSGVSISQRNCLMATSLPRNKPRNTRLVPPAPISSRNVSDEYSNCTVMIDEYHRLHSDAASPLGLVEAAFRLRAREPAEFGYSQACEHIQKTDGYQVHLECSLILLVWSSSSSTCANRLCEGGALESVTPETTAGEAAKALRPTRLQYLESMRNV